MRIFFLMGLFTSILGFVTLAIGAETPKIAGKPEIDAPAFLDWPADRGLLTPNLNDPRPTSSTMSTHRSAPATWFFPLKETSIRRLGRLWRVSLLRQFEDRPLVNWLYTTSPPISLEQLQHGVVQVGNLYVHCRPAVVIASRKIIKKLIKAGFTEGPAIPLLQDGGGVALQSNPGAVRPVLGFWAKRGEVGDAEPGPGTGGLWQLCRYHCWNCGS